MKSASAISAADADPRAAIHAAPHQSAQAARPVGDASAAQWAADADEAALRRRAKRQALLLMAASSLVMIALLGVAWLAFR
jgi:hypothetical protein